MDEKLHAIIQKNKANYRFCTKQNLSRVKREVAAMEGDNNNRGDPSVQRR